MQDTQNWLYNYTITHYSRSTQYGIHSVAYTPLQSIVSDIENGKKEEHHTTTASVFLKKIISLQLYLTTTYQNYCIESDTENGKKEERHTTAASVPITKVYSNRHTKN